MWKALIFKLEIIAFMELRFLKERKHTYQPSGRIYVNSKNWKAKKGQRVRGEGSEQLVVGGWGELSHKHIH